MDKKTREKARAPQRALEILNLAVARGEQEERDKERSRMDAMRANREKGRLIAMQQSAELLARHFGKENRNA